MIHSIYLLQEEEKNEEVTCIQCDDKMQYNITNLKKYTAYDITVTAFTAVGKGNGTTDSSRTSEDSEDIVLCHFYT